MSTLSENKKYILNVITNRSSKLKERIIGHMTYVDPYISTRDIRINMIHEKRNGMGDTVFSYREIRNACDSLCADGKLIKAERTAGTYAQYAIPPTGGWVAGRTNFHKRLGVDSAERLVEIENDIDVVGNCANCGVEFHIHKSS